MAALPLVRVGFRGILHSALLGVGCTAWRHALEALVALPVVHALRVGAAADAVDVAGNLGRRAVVLVLVRERRVVGEHGH